MVMNRNAPRWPAAIGLVSGAAMMLSAAAHWIGGWGGYAAYFSDAAVSPHVDGDIVGGLHAGWVWGSFAMLAFGCIVLGQAWRAWRGLAIDRAVVGSVALAYVGFGAWACVLRGRPHFLAFVLTGLFVAVLLRSRPAVPGASEAGASSPGG